MLFRSKIFCSDLVTKTNLRLCQCEEGGRETPGNGMGNADCKLKDENG